MNDVYREWTDAKHRERTDRQQRRRPAVETVVEQLAQRTARVRPASLLAVGAIWRENRSTGVNIGIRSVSFSSVSEFTRCRYIGYLVLFSTARKHPFV